MRSHMPLCIIACIPEQQPSFFFSLALFSVMDFFSLVEVGVTGEQEDSRFPFLLQTKWRSQRLQGGEKKRESDGCCGDLLQKRIGMATTCRIG